jgi:tetratricopeptide (TPR) repeat protein
MAARKAALTEGALSAPVRNEARPLAVRSRPNCRAPSPVVPAAASSSSVRSVHNPRVPDGRGHAPYNLACALYELRQYNEATEHYERAIRLRRR